MAQWHSQGKLAVGTPFINESIIGSQFTGSIEGLTKVGDKEAIIPGIQGWARQYGYNSITIDEDDPFAYGFQVL
jgi:4-hydroxyproline epimerase